MMVFMARLNAKLTHALFEEDVDGAEAGGHVGEDLAVVANGSDEGAEIFDIGGLRNFREGGDLIGLRANARGGGGATQEIGVDGAKFSVEGGKVEIALSEALEEGRDVVYMGSEVGVEHDDVVEVGCNTFKAFDDLIDDLDEPPGLGTAALGHVKPFEEPGGGAERGKGDGVLVKWLSVVEQRHEVEQGKMHPFLRESRTSPTEIGLVVVLLRAIGKKNELL